MFCKRKLLCLAIIVGVAAMTMPIIGISSARAEGGPFTIARLEMCTGVENREPVGVTDTFTADIGIVSAFLEARDIPAETTVSFVWFHGDEEVARVPVKIGQSGRWRTHSSKKLGGRIGAWKVEIQDAQNALLGTAAFTVN
ncbi:MAG: DUF2914 domain-containing protein [Pseudomonadota bacterium]